MCDGFIGANHLSSSDSGMYTVAVENSDTWISKVREKSALGAKKLLKTHTKQVVHKSYSSTNLNRIHSHAHMFTTVAAVNLGLNTLKSWKQICMSTN